MKPYSAATCRRGHVVEVTFLDHVEDADAPFVFTAWGRVRSVAKDHIVIASWDYPDIDHTEGKESDQANRKRFTILKSTIKSMVKLEAKQC